MIRVIATNLKSGNTYSVDSATYPDDMRDMLLEITVQGNDDLAKPRTHNWSFGIETTADPRLLPDRKFHPKAAALLQDRVEAAVAASIHPASV